MPDLPLRGHHEIQQAAALLAGDTVPPTVTLKGKGRRLTITVRDAGGVDSIVLRCRRCRRVLHGSGKALYRITLALPKTAGRINVLALDRVGNHGYLG